MPHKQGTVLSAKAPTLAILIFLDVFVMILHHETENKI